MAGDPWNFLKCLVPPTAAPAVNFSQTYVLPAIVENPLNPLMTPSFPCGWDERDALV